PPPGCYRVGPTNHATIFIADAPSSTNQPPLVEIANPTNGAVFTAPANIFIIASLEDPDGLAAHATVEFFANNDSLGMGQLFDPGPPHSAPFRFIWTNAPPGEFTLTAKATDEQGAIGN